MVDLSSIGSSLYAIPSYGISKSWNLTLWFSRSSLSLANLAIAVFRFIIIEPIFNASQVVIHSIIRPLLVVLKFLGIDNVTYEQMHFFFVTFYQFISVAILFGILVGVGAGLCLNFVSYLLTPTSKVDAAKQHRKNTGLLSNVPVSKYTSTNSLKLSSRQSFSRMSNPIYETQEYDSSIDGVSRRSLNSINKFEPVKAISGSTAIKTFDEAWADSALTKRNNED